MHLLKAYICKIEKKKLQIQMMATETMDDSDWEEIETQ